MNIENKSPKKILDLHSSQAPVNLQAIANDLGVNILHADLGEDIAGVVRKDLMFGGSSGYLILVNSRDGTNRQRFTIAHELAHFLLHKEYIGDGIKENALYRSNLSNSMERQANRLAANILMPRILVDKLMSQYKGDITLVAKKLQVSQEALKILLS